ncbi:MAG: hypothetical protein WCX63_03175 [Methanoregula sp.]
MGAPFSGSGFSKNVRAGSSGFCDGNRDDRGRCPHTPTSEECHPRQEVPGREPDKKSSQVKDGTISTSAGVSAGIDMALGFVADRFGRDVAPGVAQGIEYEWHEDPARDPFAEMYG